ncbi:MAG: TetR/AcrR family transcriptional regulator [Verrucomicrobiota bacterium]
MDFSNRSRPWIRRRDPQRTRLLSGSGLARPRTTELDVVRQPDEREGETRSRIVEAAIELHRTIGPASTTVSEIAERAGVGRVTVTAISPTS